MKKYILAVLLLATIGSSQLFAYSNIEYNKMNSSYKNKLLFHTMAFDITKARNLTMDELNGTTPIFLDSDTKLVIPYSSPVSFGQRFALSAISSDTNILSIESNYSLSGMNLCFTVTCTPISLGQSTATIVVGNATHQFIINVVDSCND